MINQLDINWRMFAEERTKALGIWPNQLWHHRTNGSGALIVKKSQRFNEYPLSKAGLDYVVDAVQSGKITAGFVGLRNGRGEIVTCKNVLDVASLVQNAVPRDGPFGQYWWVRADLTLDSRDETPFGRELASDEIPF
jgi:hypothetical protein